MAKLHFLMAENQFRLGLDNRASFYTDKAKKSLYSALKIEPDNIFLSIF